MGSLITVILELVSYIVVLFLKMYDFVLCDSYLGMDPSEMKFLGCLVVVLYQVYSIYLIYLFIYYLF